MLGRVLRVLGVERVDGRVLGRAEGCLLGRVLGRVLGAVRVDGRVLGRVLGCVRLLLLRVLFTFGLALFGRVLGRVLGVLREGGGANSRVLLVAAGAVRSLYVLLGRVLLVAGWLDLVTGSRVTFGVVAVRVAGCGLE